MGLELKSYKGRLVHVRRTARIYDGERMMPEDDTYARMIAEGMGPRCQMAPPGWYCSRPAGHTGPCAASTYPPQDQEPPARYGAYALLGLLILAAVGCAIAL